jgi:Tfp pilus assembly protein PilO
MRFTGRERILLSIIITVAIAAGFWFFFRAPLTAEQKTLQAALEQKKARLAEMQAIADQREALEREYAARQERIPAIEAKLPAAREIPTLLRQMQAVAQESGVKLTLLRPGPLETPATAPAGPAAPPAAGQPPAGQPAAQPPPYRLFRLELAFEGTYDTVLAFLRRLENFPRFIAVTQFTLTPLELPRLRLSVTSNTFVLPD